MGIRIVVTEVLATRETWSCQRRGPHCSCRHQTEVYHALIVEVFWDGNDPIGVFAVPTERPPVLRAANAVSPKPKRIAA